MISSVCGSLSSSLEENILFRSPSIASPGGILPDCSSKTNSMAKGLFSLYKDARFNSRDGHLISQTSPEDIAKIWTLSSVTFKFKDCMLELSTPQIELLRSICTENELSSTLPLYDVWDFDLFNHLKKVSEKLKSAGFSLARSKYTLSVSIDGQKPVLLQWSSWEAMLLEFARNLASAKAIMADEDPNKNAGLLATIHQIIYLPLKVIEEMLVRTQGYLPPDFQLLMEKAQLGSHFWTHRKGCYLIIKQNVKTIADKYYPALAAAPRPLSLALACRSCLEYIAYHYFGRNPHEKEDAELTKEREVICRQLSDFSNSFETSPQSTILAVRGYFASWMDSLCKKSKGEKSKKIHRDRLEFFDYAFQLFDKHIFHHQFTPSQNICRRLQVVLQYFINFKKHKIDEKRSNATGVLFKQEEALFQIDKKFSSGIGSIFKKLFKSSVMEKVLSSIDNAPHILIAEGLKEIEASFPDFLKEIDDLHGEILNKIEEFIWTLPEQLVLQDKAEWISRFKEDAFEYGLLFWQFSMLLEDAKATRSLFRLKKTEVLLPDSPIIAFMELHGIEELFSNIPLKREARREAESKEEKLSVQVAPSIDVEGKVRDASHSALSSPTSVSSRSINALPEKGYYKNSATFTLSASQKPAVIRRILESLGFVFSAGTRHDKVLDSTGQVVTLISRSSSGLEATGTRRSIEKAINSSLEKKK